MNFENNSQIISNNETIENVENALLKSSFSMSNPNTIKSGESVNESVLITNNSVSVEVVEFCPFEWASNLIAYDQGSNGKLCLAAIKATESGIVFEHIEDFIVGTRIAAIAWSPQTNLIAIPKVIKLAIASLYDKRIKILNASLKAQSANESDENNIFVVNCNFGAHTSFVNDLVFEPQSGSLIASVGDDCQCCFWSAEDGSLASKIKLVSAGVSIKWHPLESDKILIAERKGVIRLYNVETRRPIMSFDCKGYPLMSADWCLYNPLLIGCVIGSEVAIWNTSISSKPIERRKAHVNGGQKFRFFNEFIFCSRGRPSSQIQVCNTKTGQILLDTTVKCGNGISWNCKAPILAVGTNGKIIFYTFNTLI
ncbi:nucleoporin Nup37-like protein [Dinothrombium tinctorium]|uniref:Nucleoporin Nup37-like protein n=1 Tax=Dinothrombium tinctorium TaxID=1965070 RepID=A0A443QKP9_9ACAR|nr:nucleoporin Nup37-like protein [Dinothrombium tinctorium]